MLASDTLQAVRHCGLAPKNLHTTSPSRYSWNAVIVGKPAKHRKGTGEACAAKRCELKFKAISQAVAHNHHCSEMFDTSWMLSACAPWPQPSMSVRHKIAYGHSGRTSTCAEKSSCSPSPSTCHSHCHWKGQSHEVRGHPSPCSITPVTRQICCEVTRAIFSKYLTWDWIYMAIWEWC